MKRIFFSFVIFTGIIVLAASCRRHASPQKDLTFIPFTKQLKQRIESSNLDIKKVQFFTDERLVLRRSLGTQKSEIKSGVILFDNGEYINEVIIPKNTPGICEGVNGDKLMVSFEVNNNTVEFGPGGINNSYFTLYAHNWNHGTAEMIYDNKTYKVECVSCLNAGDVKLLVRKTEADKLERNKRIVEGRKVDN